MMACPMYDSFASRPLALRYSRLVGIGGAGVRVVLARLPVEVAAVAGAAVLRPEALLRSPRLDERAVDRKMLVREQRLDLWMVQQPGHELLQDVAALQPLAVLGEGR